MSDIAEILNALLRRWWLLVLGVVLGTVAGFGYAAVAAKSYTASSYVVVTAVPTTAGGTQDASVPVNFAQAFGRIIEQQDIVGRAAAAIHYQGSATDYGKHIQASTSPNAPLIQIIGTAPNGDDAANYANAAADALVSFANVQTAETGVSLAVLSQATAPDSPSSPRPALDTAVGAAAGLLIGALGTMARGRATRSGPAEAEPRRRAAEAATGAHPVRPDEAPGPAEPRPPVSGGSRADGTGPDGTRAGGTRPVRRPEPRRESEPEPEPTPPPSGYLAADGEGDDDGADGDDWIAFRDRGRGLWADRLADDAPTLEVPRLPASFAGLEQRVRRDKPGAAPNASAASDDAGADGDADTPADRRKRDRDERTHSPDHRPQVH